MKKRASQQLPCSLHVWDLECQSVGGGTGISLRNVELQYLNGFKVTPPPPLSAAGSRLQSLHPHTLIKAH